MLSVNEKLPRVEPSTDSHPETRPPQRNLIPVLGLTESWGIGREVDELYRYGRHHRDASGPTLQLRVPATDGPRRLWKDHERLPSMQRRHAFGQQFLGVAVGDVVRGTHDAP